uniref:Uncharacterized protein n=1 Tax=Oryza glaberrima TaxID=4538 RepID=I1NTM9_ORYGL
WRWTRAPPLGPQVERLLHPREPRDGVREPPRERVGEPTAGGGAVVDLRASAVVIAVSTPSGPTATEGIGAADAPALGRSGGGGGDEGDGRRSKQSAVLICSNPSQTLIHTPMPLPKSTRPSVTASPELIKAQTAEFAVEISISSELKRTTVLHPPQKRRRLPPNRIVSCNT